MFLYLPIMYVFLPYHCKAGGYVPSGFFTIQLRNHFLCNSPYIYINRLYIIWHIYIYMFLSCFTSSSCHFLLKNQPKTRVFYRRSLDLIVSGSVLTFTPDLPETLEKLLGRPTRYQSKMVKPPVVKKKHRCFSYRNSLNKPFCLKIFSYYWFCFFVKTVLTKLCRLETLQPSLDIKWCNCPWNVAGLDVAVGIVVMICYDDVGWGVLLSCLRLALVCRCLGTVPLYGMFQTCLLAFGVGVRSFVRQTACRSVCLYWFCWRPQPDVWVTKRNVL